MNLTLRVRTNERSFILKQSRPWVEKYPQIAAPAGRAATETLFYETAASRDALKQRMPEVIASDPDSNILLLEDLGEARDFTGLYSGDTLSVGAADELVDFLVALHQPFSFDESKRERFANREMRRLNHEHIFDLPVRHDNGLDLDGFTPGLKEASEIITRDQKAVATIRDLGEKYLSDGPCLLHGDFYPGSWLETDSGIRIIDPEFCFLGPPAFELGVFMAHLHFARLEDMAHSLSSRYAERGGTLDEEQSGTARRFAGIEIVRRLIGVAQLSLDRSLDEKRALLESAKKLILQ